MTSISNPKHQLAVVDYLAGRLAARLADRGGDRHLSPWTPRQNVVCGVLSAAPAPPASTPPASGDRGPSDSASRSVSHDQPSLGLDIRARASAPAFEVVVGLRFAIYLEEYATLDELRQHAMPDDSSAGATADGVVEPAEQPRSLAHAKLRDSNAHESPAEASPRLVRARGPRRVNVIGAWRRKEIVVDDLLLSIPADEAVVELSEPIYDAIRRIVSDHYALPTASRKFRTRTRTLPTAALESEESYRAALRGAEDPAFVPTIPVIKVAGFAQTLADGTDVLLSVSAMNATVQPERTDEDLAAYDVQLVVKPGDSVAFLRQRLTLAPNDYRYADVSEVPGHGRSCVALGDSTAVRTETLPRFEQPVVEHRSDHTAPLLWASLGVESNPILDSVDEAMVAYANEWAAFVSGLEETRTRTVSRNEQARFDDELRRFRLGRRAMTIDPRLERAFRLANRVFATANAGLNADRWRFFQIVYLVSHLPDLAAREHEDAELRAELDWADVLWIPTGGGKTEAYLGLVLTALYYDRLRGKDKGTTAWLKFPLRMLSVQQLSRVLRLLVVADQIRRDEEIPGAPFELGYLVGGSNTPNALRWPDGWWPGMAAASALAEGELDPNRIVGRCPYCQADTVGLHADGVTWRLSHVCRACGQTLPIHMSDDEIHRYAPSVLVGTIDKLAGFAFFGEFTNFVHGARWRCPAHGFFSFPMGRDRRCLAGDACSINAADHEQLAEWRDPVPALIIQDELHLVREELGTFDAHYEGLLTELQRSMPTGLPSKILAASATIEQFEGQIHQVYGRRARAFPTLGFSRRRSAYLQEQDEVRRVYLGVLPHYRHKADVAALIQSELITAIAELQDSDDASRGLGIEELDRPTLNRLLFDYEVSLSYVNSKPAGDAISDELDALSLAFEAAGSDPIDRRVLTGAVRLAELAESIARIEEETLATPRAKRLRALVGTSVVSHGVDLVRLNCLVMTGLPATTADYIQASSRSGRARVGLIVTVFDPFSRRERSAYSNFQSTHRFLDRMVEPVPVNKYARFGFERTLPGIAMALLWDAARDPSLSPPIEGIRKTRTFRPWWNAKAPDLLALLKERLERSYRAYVSGTADRVLEDELVSAVLERWERFEVPTLRQFDKDNTRELFRSRVLTSFRDIDEPVSFAPEPQSSRAYEALFDARTSSAFDASNAERENNE
jgi:hypothetical protein